MKPHHDFIKERFSLVQDFSKGGSLGCELTSLLPLEGTPGLGLQSSW